MQLSSELLQAYLESEYHVYQGNRVETLRVGEKSSFMINLMRKFDVTNACLITAWNPYSRTVRKTENWTRNQQLINDIRQKELPFHYARGEHPNGGWPREDSLLVFGPTRETTMEWCRCYRQHAVIWFGRDGIPTLLLRNGKEVLSNPAKEPG